MAEIILIGDPRVKNIPVQECGEPIVDLAIEFPGLVFDFKRAFVQKQASSISFARKEMGKRLLQVAGLLPSGYNLLIKECHRPMWVQKIFWDEYYLDLQQRFPHWSESQIYDECSKLNAPLDVAPHTTGGAVDLTLTDADGKWLDMGTQFNASPMETKGATYTDARNISDTAKAHRKILSACMQAAGFVNYPTEWWHWSFGDKYWALLTGQPYALYSSQEIVGFERG